MVFLNRKKDLVGIDIGSSSVKLVQLREQKGSFQLVNAGILPLPTAAIVDNTLMDTAPIVEAVKRLVSDLGITAKEVACSISGNSVIIRKISLQEMSQEELEDQIHWEAEQYIPFDIKDVNIDFQILAPDPHDAARMEVLLVASKKDIINDYLAVFAEAGLTLSLVDVDSFAVQNAFEVNYETDPEEVVAVVNIGASIMNMNAIKAGISLFTRDVQMGGNLYTEEIQKQLGMEEAEAESVKMLADQDNPQLLEIIDRINESIAQEINRSLEFYNSTANEDRIARVFLSGGCSRVVNLTQAIADKLALPVEIINPFTKVEVDKGEFDADYLQEIGPLMTVATGLAIRRVGDK